MNTILVLVLAGVVGCVGYGLMFHSGVRELLFSAIGSFFVTAFYAILTQYTELELLVTALLSACVAGAYASLMARVLRCPSTVLLTLVLMVLVPGRYLYETVFSYITRDYGKAFESLRCTMDAAIGIAAGIILAGLLDYALLQLWHRMDTRAKQK